MLRMPPGASEQGQGGPTGPRCCLGQERLDKHVQGAQLSQDSSKTVARRAGRGWEGGDRLLAAGAAETVGTSSK